MTLRDRLETLLAEPEADAAERARTAFPDAVADRPIVLYGAGGAGRRALQALRAAGSEPVAFADRGADGDVDGVPALTPDEAAARFGRDGAFVVTVVNPHVPHRSVAEALAEAGCERVVPFAHLAWHVGGELLPYFAIDLPQGVLRDRGAVLRAFDLLADEDSRAEYVDQIEFRLTGDPTPLRPHLPLAEQYLAPDLLTWRADEVFVDAGAFDGDTIRGVLEHSAAFGRIVALEPDPVNLDRLGAYVSDLPEDVRERIDLEPYAVAAERGTARFAASGLASASLSDEGDVEVDTAPLDEVVADRHPTYIKLDVEGAEPDALRGTTRIIERERPVLAVCVYHAQDHLWTLPVQVAQLAADYRLHLRRYEADFFQDVLYAVPAERSAA